MKKAHKIAEVERILNRETPIERRNRRMDEEYYPLRDMLEAKRTELEIELDIARKICKHIHDDGVMVYLFCKLCGKKLEEKRRM